MKTHYVSVNGQLCEAEKASLPVSDLAIQRGYGIFDFFKTIQGKPIFLEDHLDRFYRSAKEMHLDTGRSREELKVLIGELMEANRMPDSGVKLILTGGNSSDGYSIGKPNLVITQSPYVYTPEPPEKGLALLSCNHQRQLPSVKTLDYVEAIRLRSFLIEKGADDLLYHQEGMVRECPRSNFFIVTKDEILTPEREILHGITRGHILKLNVPGYRVCERDFTLEEVKLSAVEAFITSTTQNATPVFSIDGVLIGNGQVGAVTRKVSQRMNIAIELVLNNEK